MKSHSIYRETCELGTDFVANSVKNLPLGVMILVANGRLLQVYYEEVTMFRWIITRRNTVATLFLLFLENRYATAIASWWLE